MEAQEQIRQRLRQMAGEVGPDYTMLGTAKSVDEDEKTCVLHDEESGLDYHDIRLRPVLDGKESHTLFPKVGTWVLAIRIEESDDWMAIAFGEIAKWTVSCEEVIFNDGDNGGMVIWPDTKQQLDLCKQFIQAIKDVSSTPINEPGNGSPSAYQAAINAAISSINVPDFENLEDDKVKH